MDFVQLMLNAREMSMKTEQMEINLDKEEEEEKFEENKKAKGMILEVSTQQ